MFAKESKAMLMLHPDLSLRKRRVPALLILLAAIMILVPAAFARKKKTPEPAKNAKQTQKVKIDTAVLAWPSPPYIARVRWMAYYAGMKIDYTAPQKKKKKQSWMDRLAGAQQKDGQQILKEFPFQLIGPSGIAIDSKGLVYVADQRVGAVFIFNAETREVHLIRNGRDAKFGWINCVAIDDSDRLFVSDAKLHRVLVFDANHKVSNVIEEGLRDPNGIAIDNDNRLVYVVDTALDQVLVYDADSLKLLRKIGTTGKDHWLTTPGDFAEPTNIAIDNDGNIYVTDTLNNRVEIFDADGNFVSWFGKHGDGPGYLARPKGIAVDSDGHIWVVDQMEDRVQVFDKQGELLTYFGEHGNYPGQFASAVGIAIDKQNRVFVTDQYPGRLQMFRYVTDAEAAAEKAKREAEGKKPGAGNAESAAQVPPAR
jgi:DNA-binding beta-propeller fold protein YncE